MIFRSNKKMKSFNLLGILLLVLLISCSEKTNADSSKALETKSASYSENTTGKVTFIELGSVGCVPCQAMVPVMDDMRKELADQVEVVFHDVWTEEGEPFGRQYGIRVIPTQVFLDKEGNEYYRHEGYFAKEEVYAILKQGGVEIK